MDTIRYYMELGLVIPGKNGNLYDFTEDCVEDIHWIHKLKEMGFSLKEIQQVLALRRNSNWVEPQEIAEYLMLLDEKKKGLYGKIDGIREEIGRIEEEQEQFLRKNAGDKVLVGVPLKALEYLRCPFCGQVFSVETSQMNSRYLYNGSLYCDCGYRLAIRDGIILAPDARIRSDGEICAQDLQGEKESGADLERKKYRDLPASVLTAMQRTYNFMLHRILALPLSGRLVLETDINDFFYLYTHFRKIETRALFIVTDRYEPVLKMYKERIEYMKLDLDIVYLACEGEILPLREGCVDLRIDYFSANARKAGGRNYFSEQAERCMKVNGKVIGCLFSGQNESCRCRRFSKDCFAKFMEEKKYRIKKERTIPCPPEAGKDNALWVYEYERGD